MPQLPSNPFFTSRSDRVELARQRYFEEGQMPSGVISDAVFPGGHSKCSTYGHPNCSTLAMVI